MRGPMHEDCLFLNVWTPAKDASEKLSVMIYLHGGSGTRGSGSIPIYEGEQMAKKGVIVVTFNFRLGILGGMGHPQLTAESPHKVFGNYGMLDMIAALKWVHDNIASFGGDPQKVTLCAVERLHGDALSDDKSADERLVSRSHCRKFSV